MEKYFQEKLDSIEAVVIEMKKQQDKMTEALVVLARVEERQIADHNDLLSIKKSQDEVFKRLRTVENTQTTSVVKLGYGEKALLWIIGLISSAIAAVLAWNLKP